MRTNNAETLTLTIPEAARLLGIGRTKAFEMARAGELPGVLRFGRAYRISKPVLLRWLGAEEPRANGNGRPPAATPDEV